MGNYVCRSYGHAKILNIVGINIFVDYTLSEPAFNPGYVMKIPDRSFYDNSLHVPENATD